MYKIHKTSEFFVFLAHLFYNSKSDSVYPCSQKERNYGTNHIDSLRLTACHTPPRISHNADMGCGANDWFVSISEHKEVKSCSFIAQGQPLRSPTYQALVEATQNLPRLPCYRSYQSSQIGQLVADRN